MTAGETRGSVVEIPALGPRARFDHIGLVVASIEEASPASEPVFDPIQKVRVAFVALGGLTVELVEPVGDDSPVMNSLRKGTKLVHACYTVPDLNEAIAGARRNGFFCLGQPEPAVAFSGRRIAWIYSRVFGLVELLEEAGS